MRLNTLTAALSAGALTLGLAGPSQAAEILVNFGDTAYVTDGSNVWQTIDVNTTGDTATSGPLNTTPTALVDTSGAASGITLTLSGSPSDIFTHTGATAADIDESFAWFDDTVAQQQETYAFGDTDESITYTFTGFAATDTVVFEFVAARAGSGTRQIDIAGPDSLSINDADTNGGGVTVSQTVTGATSYSYTLTKEDGSFPAAANAFRIDVTPIPEPASLALMGLGGLLMLGRSRRRA